jgi:GNAT superfamily N-acetyltransferase
MRVDTGTESRPTPDVTVIAADHPALGRDIDDFLDRIQLEPRRFGPSARTNPKPSPSLIASLRGRGGFRMAAVIDRGIVGLARVDGGGELFIVVDPAWRGRGVGTDLGRAMAHRASDLHYARVVLRSTRRSRAARRIGEGLGAIVVERGRGRMEFILDLTPTGRTA